MPTRPSSLQAHTEALQGPSPLRATCEAILRLHWVAVNDIGDAPYDLVANLLKLSSAPQLSFLEDNSPHIRPFTNEIWKDLCVADFIDVRKQVEDGQVKPEDELASWKERYSKEQAKREIKMQSLLSKMRGQYTEYSSGRGSVQSIDGLRQEKRRKTSHTPSLRPKTLFEKAKSNTRAIASVYAPRRSSTPATTVTHKLAEAQSSTAMSAAAAGDRLDSAVRTETAGVAAEASVLRKRPAITTIVRTVKRPAPSSAISPPPTRPAHPSSYPSSSIQHMSRPTPCTRPASFSPPPHARARLLPPPSRDLSARPQSSKDVPPAQLALSPAGSPPPPKGMSKPGPSLFMPKSRRP
ncbi:hypothetical protein JCM11641_007276 [Rhodosporidiobolus odoratus]